MEIIELPVADRRLWARATGAGETGGCVLVALHGGGYEATYFEPAGANLHEIAARESLACVAITRPGYGTSGGELPFDAAAAVLDVAIGALCERLRPASVVLVGHSIGGAIAVHLAARTPDWPLVGLSITGVGLRPAAGAAGAFAGLPLGEPVKVPFAAVRPALYGPDWTVDGPVERFAPLLSPFPVAEVHEIYGAWLEDLPRLGPQVRVPVHYALGEFDGLWQNTGAHVAEVAAAFSSASWVDAQLWRATGHNLDHHRTGRALHLVQCAFAHRCRIEAGGAPIGALQP